MVPLVEPYPPPMVRLSAVPTVTVRFGIVAAPVTFKIPLRVVPPLTVSSVIVAVLVIVAVVVEKLLEDKLVAPSKVAPPKLVDGFGGTIPTGI